MDLKSSFAVVFLLRMLWNFCRAWSLAWSWPRPPTRMNPDLFIRVGSVPLFCVYGNKWQKPLKIKTIVWLLHKQSSGVFYVWSFSQCYGFSMLSNQNAFGFYY